MQLTIIFYKNDIFFTNQSYCILNYIELYSERLFE
jgi:hypothetical protein